MALNLVLPRRLVRSSHFGDEGVLIESIFGDKEKIKLAAVFKRLAKMGTKYLEHLESCTVGKIFKDTNVTFYAARLFLDRISYHGLCFEGADLPYINPFRPRSSPVALAERQNALG